MTAEPYSTTIRIAAAPPTVYEHFIRPDLLVGWMGDYAVLDPQPGGEFTVDINGIPVGGRYLELDPPHRLLISWGHAGSDEFPPGSSRVEITLTPEADETIVELRHTGIPRSQSDQHALGWPHFLGRLAVAASGRSPGPDPWSNEPPAGP